MTTGSITAHDLSNRAGVTFRQVDYWTRAGYLNADPVHPRFRHRPRTYPPAQADRARLMAQLIDTGMTARTAQATAVQLLEHGTAQLGPFTLTTTGGTAA